jgi:hypothetical protein
VEIFTAGSGQFDSQRKAIEAGTDRSDNRGVLRGQIERGLERLSAIKKELYRRRGGEGGKRRERRGIRESQRRNDIFVLAIEMEARATGNQDTE